MQNVIQAALARAAQDQVPDADRRHERVLFGGEQTTLSVAGADIPVMILEGRKRVTTRDGAAALLGMDRRGLAGLLRSRIGKALPRDIQDAFRTPLPAMQPNGKRLKVVELSKVLRLGETLGVFDRAGLGNARSEAVAGRMAQIAEAASPRLLKGEVDEVTGFDRWIAETADDPEARHYLGSTLREDGKRFPNEYYIQLYRLLGWDRDPLNPQRPPVVGKITKKLIYSALPDSVQAELERRNPVREGRHYRGGHHHRYLSSDLGGRALNRQIDQVIVLMRIAPDWPSFKRLFSAAFESGKPARGYRIEPDLRLDRRRPTTIGMG